MKINAYYLAILVSTVMSFTQPVRSAEQPQTEFGAIPQPVLREQIMGRLPAEDIASLGATARRYRQLAQEPHLAAQVGATREAAYWGESRYPYIFKELNHRSPVQAMAFSPDDQLLATGTADGSVYIWNTQPASSSVPLHELRGHKSKVNSVAFSPNGLLLASASDDMTIRLWNVKNGKKLYEFSPAPKGVVKSVAFSPDGTFLLSLSEDATTGTPIIIKWEIPAKHGFFGGKPRLIQIKKLPLGSGFYLSSLVSSPDGRFFACRIGKDNLALIHAQSLMILGRTLGATGAFSADTQFFVTGSEDGWTRLYEIKNLDATKHDDDLELLQQVDGDRSFGFLDAIAFSPFLSIVATGEGDIDGGKIALCKLEHGKHGGRCVHMMHEVSSIDLLTFSTNGKILACAIKNGAVELYAAKHKQKYR